MAPTTRSKQPSTSTTADNAESSGKSTVTSPNLGFESSATSLRSRFSPRDAEVTGFESERTSYPSPAASRSILSAWKRNKGQTSAHKKDDDAPQLQPTIDDATPIAARFATTPIGGADTPPLAEPQRPEPSYLAVDSTDASPPPSSSRHSPILPATLAVPRYDARGYPIKAAPEFKVGGSPAPSVPSPRRSPRTSDRGSRPQSGSEDEGTPKKLRYPPSSYTPADSTRSSLYSGDNTPTRSRRPSDASAGEGSLAALWTGLDIERERGQTPGPSLWGDSTYSFETQTEGSAQPFAGRDFAQRRFTLQVQHPEHSGSAYFASTDSIGGGYADFAIEKQSGKRVYATYIDDPDVYETKPEDDDYLHDPHDPELLNGHKQRGLARSLLTPRGAGNLGCVTLLLLGIVVLFAGYPIITHYADKGHPEEAAPFVQPLPPLRGPIDSATPQEAYNHKSLETGEQWQLIFSDEFNTDGRTFYPGEDPYWEAEDLHYWPTNNKEWYDPGQITTRDGNLVVTLTNRTTNGRNYTGGLMTSWNRFCFTGAYVEAKVSLPGTSDVAGLWPAIWTMGNLGRAGYGGTTDGTWPYSYDSCDVGTLANQTLNGQPRVALTQGDKNYKNVLSYLPGQRLSACTCPNDPTHPGPKRADGSFVGRSAPEIDMFEAAVDPDTHIGEVSLSGQWAPFNPNYQWVNTSDTYSIYDRSRTKLNKYQGGVYQQATSALGETDQRCYTGNDSCLSTYGFEYAPGDDGYISWVNDGVKAWTLREQAMAPNAAAQIGQRYISKEPMYMIINLGLSENFGPVDYDGLDKQWPVEMHVDYIRVYQDPKNINVGCDPKDYPTYDYIERFKQVYNNPNITTYDQVVDLYPNATWPKNSLLGC